MFFNFIPKNENFENVALRHVHVPFGQGVGVYLAALAGIDCNLLIVGA